MRNTYSISIIVPVYNEVQIIEPSIATMNSFIDKNFDNYEIIIVESGSTDGSYELCDRIANSYKNITTIHEGSRNGFGSALKIGYKNATKDLIWLITVDLPFPLDSINKALPLLSHYDCVLSYRSKDNRKIGRKIQSFAYNNIVKLFLGLKVKHINSAFKVFKKETIKDMTIISNGWFLDAEMLYRLKNDRISYIEIPVELIERKSVKSSVKLLTPVALLKDLIFFLKNKNNPNNYLIN